MYHDIGFYKSMKMIPLKKGDTLGIISPAGSIKHPEKLEKAVEFLTSVGYKVLLAPNILACEDYLAGSDDLRAADLHWAFKNPEIKAVLCSRGGYGCARLLDKIDFELISQNPKPLFGFSDITVLLNTLPCPVFHAPMAVSDFGADKIDDFTAKNFLNILEGFKPDVFEASADFEVINGGNAKVELAGGNLTSLVSLLGTKYFPDLSGKILLLEDVNEELYKIDRMLTQLKLAGVFETVSGVIFAGFGETQVSADFLKQFLPVSLPAFKGFYASHDMMKYTLPFGLEYFLDANKGILTYL